MSDYEVSRQLSKLNQTLSDISTVLAIMLGLGMVYLLGKVIVWLSSV